MTHPLLDKLMVGLTIGGLALLPALGVALLMGQGRRRVGLAILASLGLGLLLTLVFQFSALRPRPEGMRLLLPTPNYPSYPSGHTAAAFGTALVVGLSYRRWRWWAVTLGGAGLIAFSRVYLGHHYPSDILGGASLGAAVGATCYGLIVVRRSTSQSVWQWLLWPQIALVVIITQMAYLDILPQAFLHLPLIDKLLHFLLIGSIAFWLNLWFRGRTVPVRGWYLPLALIIPLSVAMLEEGVQFFSPVRSADLGDLFSDLAGLLFFWWLSLKIIQKDTSPNFAVADHQPPLQDS